ncbi:MAG: monovalent cation/H(+) antiporter subunit G [Planctomycetota bacterium]|jgi:multicomponent Na+:H+ antiporter subunit G|nr:sodium:proton antiporter [Planctomycetota bacterium]MDP6839341.1 monovalent cation/H(+) antiporter subunit G [Planctomycetota bacterium]MDP6957066.1 monovalent cation/H(+) antiporter subunit G [Planctomycetota bacterium]
MEAFLDYSAWACLGLGSFLVLVAGLGLIRLPDFYTRVHGAGVTDTLAAASILVGLMLQSDAPLVIIKLICIALFLGLTSPTAGHALVKAAWLRGLEPWTRERAAEGVEGEEVTPS